MSVEQINMAQGRALVPTLGLIAMIFIVCVGVWYGTKLGCILLNQIIRLFDSGRLKRKKHCECSK